MRIVTSILPLTTSILLAMPATASADCSDSSNSCAGLIEELRTSQSHASFALVNPIGTPTVITECNGDVGDTMLRLAIDTEIGRTQYSTLLSAMLDGRSVELTVVGVPGTECQNLGGTLSSPPYGPCCYIDEVRLRD